MELCTLSRAGQHAVDGVEEGIMLLDEEGCITYLDGRAAALLGHSPDTTRGVTLPKLLGHDTGEDSDVVQTMHKEGELLCHFPASDDAAPVEIRFHHVAGGSEPERYIGVVRNLGAVDAVEQNRRNQLHRERVFKECISHHFFNPLCIAQGYLQLVLNRENAGDEEAMLAAAMQALARIETVVKNVVYDGDLRE